MAKISQKTIDLIKDSADIVDVISEYVPLQAAGKNMKGLCPFHSEKTPSFFVSKERQIFNCFGCGEKGNAITFIQKYKHLSFVESLQYLADKYHVDIEFDDQKSRQNQSQSLYRANEMALQFFSLNLLNMASGKPALDYLVSRGLDLQTIQNFDLGYAPKDSHALLEQLGKDFQALELYNAGLINKGDGDYYDLFRNRIMFPIRDEQGRVIAFSGRVFKDEDNPAKYVNTGQTDIFVKSFVLYNLDKALPHIRQQGRVVLMEGYMDVIKANIANVKETVCSMGTQLTADQALKLKQYTDNVIICYDGDRAGKEATYKALKMLEQAKLNVNIVLMPDGMDPDEYISKHADFASYIDEHLIDQYEFVYQMICERKDLTKAVDIEAAKHQLFDFFSKTSGTIRDIYFNKFANDTLVNIDTLMGDYRQNLINERIQSGFKQQTLKKKANPKQMPKFKKAEEKIINYMMKDLYYRQEVSAKQTQIFFNHKPYWMIFNEALEKHKTFSSGNFVVAVKAALSEQVRNDLDAILLPDDYDYTHEEFEACISILEEAKINDDMEVMIDQSNQLLRENKTEAYKQLSKQILEKRKYLHEIIERRRHGKNANHQ